MTHSDPVLIVGADSTIGAGLMTALRHAGHSVIGTTRRRDTHSTELRYLNLADATTDWDIPANVSTALLCVANTSQAECTNNPEETAFINVDQTQRLARRILSQGTRVIFLSTNLVFDGKQPFPAADSQRNPQTEYGRQKAAVEESLEELGDRVCIVRITKVLAGNSILHEWMTNLNAGKPIRAFHDLPVSPVALPFVIDVLRTIIETELQGVLQIGASDEITYATLARELATELRCDPQLVVESSAQSLPYHVPDHASLDTTRLHKELGVAPPDSRDSVRFLLNAMPSSPDRRM